MDDLIETAKKYMEDHFVAKAFFYLALAAIEQLTIIAQAQEQIATRVYDWGENGTLSVTTHKQGEY
jgi:hypothetical protein